MFNATELKNQWNYNSIYKPPQFKAFHMHCAITTVEPYKTLKDQGADCSFKAIFYFLLAEFYVKPLLSGFGPVKTNAGEQFMGKQKCTLKYSLYYINSLIIFVILDDDDNYVMMVMMISIWLSLTLGESMGHVSTSSDLALFL